MTKRSFFKQAMAMVACVALAPEIAFGVRLKPLPEPPKGNIWWLWSRDGLRQEWLTTEEYRQRWCESSDEVKNLHTRMWGEASDEIKTRHVRIVIGD